MQRKFRNADSLIQNPMLTEVLKAQLGFTSYEALAFVSVVLGNEQATSIAENTGIPRSKVYGTLESLEKKGAVIKTDKGVYQPNPAAVGSLKEQASFLTHNYMQLIETLHSYALGPPRITAKIKQDLVSIFQKNGYKVQSPKAAFSRKDEFYLTREIESLIMRSAYEREIAHGRKFQRAIIEDSTSSLSRKLTTIATSFIDFIGESTTSGIRVGSVVLAETKKVDDPMLLVALLEVVSTRWNCQNMLLVFTPEIAPSYIKDVLHYMEDSRRMFSTKTKMIIPRGNFQEEIDTYLTNLDMRWRELKDRLLEIEEIKDTTKEKIRSHIVKTDELMRQLGSIPEEYKEVYLDMFLRTRRDLQVYESLTLNLEERIANWFRMLESKEVFDIEMLSQSGKSLKEIDRSAVEKGNELANFEEEILSLHAGTNPYKKHGFLVNPFSLTVPLLKPDAIIDEDEPRKRTEAFVKGVMEGSDTNLLFITAREGGGKSHFLNFYRGKINEKEYGKAFAIRIQCRPNRDLLDLYPQITTEIMKVAKEKREERLSAAITEALAEAGTPRVISDLMRVLRGIAARISSSGHGPLFVLIDEFENALPTVVYEGKRERDFEYDRIGTPQAITQLDSLTQLSGVGFIVVIRKEILEQWKNALENRVNKYEKSMLIELLDLSLKDTKELVTHRLASSQFRKSKAEIEPPTFDENVIREIWKKALGNPRNILRIANRIFRRAVAKGVAVASAELIEA